MSFCPSVHFSPYSSIFMSSISGFSLADVVDSSSFACQIIQCIPHKTHSQTHQKNANSTTRCCLDYSVILLNSDRYIGQLCSVVSIYPSLCRTIPIPGALCSLPITLSHHFGQLRRGLRNHWLSHVEGTSVWKNNEAKSNQFHIFHSYPYSSLIRTMIFQM